MRSTGRNGRCRSVALAVGVATLAVSAAACHNVTVLGDQIDARRIVAQLHLDFVKASEAANRAVLAASDEDAAAAATEAKAATAAAESQLEALSPIVLRLGYTDEQTALERFRQGFTELRQIDAEVLPLSVENSNLKAQRLSFGAGAEALAACTDSLAKIADAAHASDVDRLVATVRLAGLEIQVIQARHIAEADDAAMTRMEAQIAAADTSAHRALDELRGHRGVSPGALAAAVSAFDRFMTTNAEIVRLSRRNSNVRSVAVTLGRKRIVVAACEDQLAALDAALAAHQFKATK